MSASPKYGSVTSSLWTPSQTGSFSLSTPIVAWLDAEDTNQITSFTDSGLKYVATFTDKRHDIAFGAPPSHEAPRLSDGTASLLINNRNTLYFWEANLQFTPDTALTATLDAFDGHLAELNDPRYAFFVYKPLDYYPNANFLYQYGHGTTGRGYGLALWVTGSGDLSDTDHYYFMASWAGGNSYRPDESDSNSFYYNNTGEGNLVYHQHSGTAGYLSADANQTTGSYSGVTLITNNFDQDLEFWVGEEIGGGGRGFEFILAEMIMFTGSGFSDNDRQLVEGYLAHKWGLTGSLSSSHPYHSSPPLNSDGVLNFTFTGSVIAPQLNSITGTYAVERDGGTNALTATIDVTGTATPGANYVNIFPKELNWEAGETGSKEFTVTFLSLPEQGEKTFIPFISGSGLAATQTPTSSATTIIYPGLTQFSSSLEDTILEAGGTTLVTIVRTSGSEGALTANLNLTGSATTGSDFTVDGLTFESEEGEIFATASFADGESTYTFAVTASDDLSDETNETLQFTIVGLAYPLSGTRFFPTATIGPRAQHTITILDLETGSLNFSPTFAHEVLVTGSQTISFAVERTIGGDGAATASIFLSEDSTATASVDFEDPGFPITLNWSPGETGTKTFNVEFKDSGTGIDRTFTPFIRNATSASIGTASFASASIVHPGTLNFSQTGSTVLEGATQTVNINRLGGTTGPVTATLEFTGPAVTGTNYTVNNLTLVTSSAGLLATAALGPGTSSYTYEIVTVDDAADTSTLSIAATIDSLEYPLSGNAFNPNASIGTGSVFTLSILDNESGSVNFSIKDIEFGQPGSGTPSSVTVTVNRETGSDFAATATIDQVAGSATKNIDYTGLPATLNWENQESGSKTFTLTGINGFGDNGATVIMGFSTLVNITTGTAIPFSTATIANTIISESPDAEPLISPNGVINSYANTITSRKTKGRAIPFAYSQRTTLTIRNQDRTISGSIGGSKNG